MTKLTIVKPESGKENKTEDPKITAAFSTLETVINGELEGTNNFKKEGIKEENLEKPIQEKLGGSFVGLKVEEKTANFEGTSAFLYICTKALTATLPAATAGRTIGVYSFGLGAGEFVKVSAKAGKKIYGGVLIAGGETAELTLDQGIIVEADGTNWAVIAGEPKREQKYTEIEIAKEGEATLSTVRPAIATVLNKEGSNSELTVGGVKIGLFGTGVPVTVWVNPSQKVKTSNLSSAVYVVL